MNKQIFKYIITSIFILSCFEVFAIDSKLASKIENNLYGFSYENESDEKRLARLETSVYGNFKTGNIEKRFNNLKKDLSAEVIGNEITPSRDTFLEEEKLVEDSSVNYPIINEIEEKLFNKTYKNRDLHTRIVTIEKKLFGKVYDVDDYSTRMDRIKAEIMPSTIANNRFEHEYRDNRVNSNDISGTTFSRFSMPFGQKKYVRPYTNYGDEFIGGAAPIDNNENLNNELSKLEMETFGTEFSNEDSTTRIQRLNSVNKAKKSSSKYDSQKFSQRMSTAMEIGAMILMILAMVL